jgi:outer membrane protein OmpA-like peptidoglycan-associated protein
MCRSLTSSTAIAALLWLVLALIPTFAAEEDESAADAAASAALNNARILDVQARVLDIDGLAGGIAAQSKDVSGEVEDLQAAMRDLNAKETELEIRIELSADVLFDFDKSEIRKDAAEELAKAATIIRGYPGANVRVIGHTDSKGKEDYNQKLSERRARSVVNWLSDRQGLEGGAFSVSGMGESEPVVPNEKPDGSDDPEGRQKNRRVEIIIKKGA